MVKTMMSRPWWWDWAETLKAQAHARLDRQRGDELVSYLLSWAGVEKSLGHAPSSVEYTKATHLSRVIVARREALFLESLPGWRSPSDTLAMLRSAVDEGRHPDLFEEPGPTP